MSLNIASKNVIDNIIKYMTKKNGGAQLWERLYQKYIFLLELEYYKKYETHITNVKFKSYEFGPFSIDVAKRIDGYNEDEINLEDEIKDEIDLIFEKWHSGNPSKDFDKIIKHIHSLMIYNLVPYDEYYNLKNFNKEDLEEILHTDKELTGEKLRKEQAVFYNIRQKSQDYVDLFEE
ncbi:MAG: Panacea domain-containing protein [Campylobacterales bacterium]|nr:Panacea domain-containing protein [Campylobacterales bacterium]